MCDLVLYLRASGWGMELIFKNEYYYAKTFMKEKDEKFAEILWYLVKLPPDLPSLRRISLLYYI